MTPGAGASPRRPGLRAGTHNLRRELSRKSCPPARLIMSAAVWVPDQRSPCSLVRDDEACFPVRISNSGYTSAFSRHGFARGLHFVVPPKMREQGMPDARCTRGLACKTGNENAHEHTGSAENIRHSLRNGFTAYNALSPATNSSCHRRCRLDG
jgi:hypothetical protein